MTRSMLSCRGALGGAISSLILLAAAAQAQDALQDIVLADGVTRAEAYEAIDQTYIVANPTDIYSNHMIYGTEEVGHLDRGTTVRPLAKVAGWEWVLVGNEEGVGIGYVPISMLAPEDLYVP